MTPVSIDIGHGGRPLDRYRMRMIDDRLLSPLLLQMALFSAIDATERTVGAASFRVTGQVEFANGPAPIKLDNMYAADNGAAALVSLSAAIPLAFVAQSGFDLKLKRIDISVEAFDEKKQLQIDGVYPARRTVRPGETVELNVSLVGDRGRQVTRTAKYQVPQGTQAGQLYFTVSDAMVANMAEIRQIVGAAPRSARHVLSIVNNLRPNTRAWVRVWHADPAYQLEGEDFPDPPASVALLFGAAQGGGGILQTRNSKIAEIPIDAGDAVISGARTVQVEVKE
jgi:hypothetical protein